MINTYSAFIYGHTVTANNQIIPLDEGFGLIAVEVAINSYSFTDFLNAVSTALNEYGSLDYTVTANRETRIITISASGNFSLLFDSSGYGDIDLRELLGYEDQDYSGASNYIGVNASGSEYQPQFKLQKYIPFEHNKKANNVNVKTTGSGKVEVVKYSDNYFMECDITLITDIVPQGAIKENPQGVADAVAFMEYATTKADIEFIPDLNDYDAYYECLLESAGNSKDGTGFQLKELYAKGLTNYYELSKLVFRRLD